MSHTMLLQVWKKILYLPNIPFWCKNMVRTFGTIWRWEEMGMKKTHLGGQYLPRCVWTPWWGGHGTWKEDMEGITVDIEPACPAAPHPNCMAVGKVIVSDEHVLLYDHDDTMGLPVHEGEIVQLDGMTLGVGMVIEGEGALICSLYLSQRSYLFHQCIHCISKVMRLISVYNPSFAS